MANCGPFIWLWALAQPALALTDLNNLFGGVKFYKEGRGKGVKPILGAEIILDFPDIPATEVPFAYHTPKAGTTVSGTWTFGSSNWNATGMTVGTVVNCSMIPHPSVVSVS